MRGILLREVLRKMDVPPSKVFASLAVAWCELVRILCMLFYFLMWCCYDDIYHFAQGIVLAVDIWLGKLNVTENKNIVLANMKRRIHRTMSQVQFEGIYSLLEVERLQFITDTWTNILDLLHSGKTEENQKILVKKKCCNYLSSERFLCYLQTN